MTRSDALLNRQQIMDAFHNATRHEVKRLPTMSDIVKLSGLGRGTVYRHFPDMGALAFSFMAVGYEALFATSRELLRAATTPEQSRAALEDHLYRFRSFTKENLALLTTPEVTISDGCSLAQTSQRQCVRRALRDMAGIGKTSPDILETAVDLISRSAEPAHLKSVGVSQYSEDPTAGFAVELALEIADAVTIRLKNLDQR